MGDRVLDLHLDEGVSETLSHPDECQSIVLHNLPPNSLLSLSQNLYFIRSFVNILQIPQSLRIGKTLGLIIL
jgi:hypothetical protein